MSDITRSEAIKQLRLLKADITHGLAFISKTKDKHPALESLDMAIASLETDEAYQLEYERTTKNDLAVDVPDNNVGKIDRPSVTPQEPKTGHWILTDDDFVYCSECEDSYYPRPIDASWYYCPHCGARMIEPQESEDNK